MAARWLGETGLDGRGEAREDALEGVASRASERRVAGLFQRGLQAASPRALSVEAERAHGWQSRAASKWEKNEDTMKHYREIRISRFALSVFVAHGDEGFLNRLIVPAHPCIPRQCHTWSSTSARHTIQGGVRPVHLLAGVSRHAAEEIRRDELVLDVLDDGPQRVEDQRGHDDHQYPVESEVHAKADPR
eukprot:3657052-Rhodomonas_salina.2